MEDDYSLRVTGVSLSPHYCLDAAFIAAREDLRGPRKSNGEVLREATEFHEGILSRNSPKYAAWRGSMLELHASENTPSAIDFATATIKYLNDSAADPRFGFDFGFNFDDDIVLKYGLRSNIKKKAIVEIESRLNGIYECVPLSPKGTEVLKALETYARKLE